MGENMDIEENVAISTATVPMPLLQQHGEVFVGPGAKKDAQRVGLGLSKLSSKRKDDLHNAKRYAMDISIKQIILRQQKQQQENAQKQQMYAQALSIMSRIYVGSISFEVREEMLRKAFDPFGPIKSINMSWDPTTGHHKTFAFVEYEIPEAALLAQESMNGQMLAGRNLKCNSMMFQEARLPTNMPQAQPIIDMVQKDAKKYFRVYVASVHPDLSETDLKSVFEAFGEVVKCQLARTPNGRGHRGFGYIEFNNITSQNEAISGMNMFDLGGQFLRVGKCVTPPDALAYLQPAAANNLPASVSVACAAITAKVMAAEAASSPALKSTPNGSRSASPAPKSPATPSSSLPTDIDVKLNINPIPLMSLSLPPPAPIIPSPQENIEMDMDMEVEEEAEDVHVEPPQEVVAPPAPAPAPIVPPPGLVAPPTIIVPKLSTQRKEEAEAEEEEEQEEEQCEGPSQPQQQQQRVKISTSQRKKLKKEALNKLTFEEKMAQVLNQQKAAQNERMTDPVTFGALDEHVAWKDPTAEEQTEAEMLAIMGPGRGGDNVQSMALALIDGGGALMLANKKKAEAAAAAIETKQKKPRRQKEAKKIQPKLNSAGALAAAAKAGEMSDALKNEVMNSEDASLASQEGLEIRGNDARHLLMTKLMRTNRSCVLILRNMVGSEDLDEYLEAEIREECEKYGVVNDVVIANFAHMGIVKIFVRFADPSQVDKAKTALDNRFFGGKTVKAEAYDQILFEHEDYSG
ncbi:unnamed protein product [Caenorhabditis angaria]|uniref:RRM domain-containing protein n=1 Tax=Caenorhabditis angaria TaxID=860376 RepID=A0A9P1I370_9PELO|nr:unnamed protein product [Caenorhabditis angaria]